MRAKLLLASSKSAPNPLPSPPPPPASIFRLDGPALFRIPSREIGEVWESVILYWTGQDMPRLDSTERDWTGLD